jgi:transcription elongation factor GreB
MPIRKRYINKGWTPEDEAPVHLTPEGIERLHERLIRLKREMPALSLEVQRTNAFGDRSENAEYQAAKRQLRRAQGQVLRLTAQLKRAVPIPKGPDADGKIRIGSAVVLEPLNGENPAGRTYRLVGPRETDPARGRISIESPLGHALIGKKRGETVAITTPRGTQEYKISEVK